MSEDDPAVEGAKNDPMMPIGWTRTYKGGRVFVTTMGSADDLPSEGVRRMIVNSVFWAAGMEDRIKPDLDVSIVGEYEPTKFGFGDFQVGRKPAFYDLKEPTLN